jgi:hypothetical protein
VGKVLAERRRRCGGGAWGGAREEDAREVKKHNACVLGVWWGEVGRVKKNDLDFGGLYKVG